MLKQIGLVFSLFFIILVLLLGTTKTLEVAADGTVAPSITTQPVPQTAEIGYAVSFSVTANGSGTLSYQWFKNGSAVGGANGSYYRTPAVTAADNGSSFTAVISNSAGTVTSSPAILTVLGVPNASGTSGGPAITTQPQSQAMPAGYAVSFSVGATGSGTLSYQWFKNGGAISGASGSYYRTPPMMAADNGDSFTVVVSDSTGTATSSPAILTVNSGNSSSSGSNSANGASPSIALTPSSASLAAGGLQSFTASVSSPISTGSLNIPSGHPRLFWNPSRIAAAQSWVQQTSYPGVTVDYRPLDYYDLAFTCLVMNNSTACATAINDATSFSTSCSTGSGCDDMRVNGEWIMLVRDWLAPGCSAPQCLTSSQASEIDSNWNTWQSNQDSPAQTWGNVGMPANNYFAGQFRNDFDFGIASYNENPSASTNLTYGIVNRWTDLLNFASLSGAGKNAGLGYGLLNQEGGGEYGRYSLDYYSLALASSAVLGQDLWTQTPAFQAGVLQTIYNTMPTQTVSRGMWDGFTWADDENWTNGSQCGYISHNGPSGTGGCGMSSQYYGDFMQAAATEFASTNIGAYARQWISTVNPAIGSIFRSVDPGGPSMAFSNLPVDYYSSGAQYMYTRDNWTPNATAMLWQMGLNQGGNPDPSAALGTGHYHQDAGTFQVSRNGVNIIRETMGYGQTVAGYNGSGTADAAIGYAHNQPLIGGQPAINVFGGCADGPGTVERLESQAAYAFAATDLTNTYTNVVCDSGHPQRQNPYAKSVVREYYFFRGIDMLVIVDRLQTDGASRNTTFVSHCETSPTVSGATVACVDGSQEALYTALAPSSPSIAVVAENANGANDPNWQYRIEANNSNPGNALSYNIYTIQLGDASGFNPLRPTIVDSNPGDPASGSFSITLDSNDNLVLNKGTASSGGTIEAAGNSNPLTTTVEQMSITSAGPMWNGR